MELNKSLFQALLIFSANSNRDGQEIPRGIHIHRTCIHRNNNITSYACFSSLLFSLPPNCSGNRKNLVHYAVTTVSFLVCLFVCFSHWDDKYAIARILWAYCLCLFKFSLYQKHRNQEKQTKVHLGTSTKQQTSQQTNKQKTKHHRMNMQ